MYSSDSKGSNEARFENALLKLRLPLLPDDWKVAVAASFDGES